MRYGYLGPSEESGFLKLLKTDMPKLALTGSLFGAVWALFLFRAIDVVDFIYNVYMNNPFRLFVTGEPSFFQSGSIMAKLLLFAMPVILGCTKMDKTFYTFDSFILDRKKL